MCLIPNYCDLKTRRPNYLDNAQSGYRVLSPVEKKKLSLACQGEIFRLLYSSLLTPEELEQVIIEALQSETDEVGVKELEAILHKVINDEERLLMIIQYPLENGPYFLLN